MEGEDQGAREARVKRLWKRLDTRNEGRLDANGLKRGLQEIDHRLYFAILASFLLMALKL